MTADEAMAYHGHKQALPPGFELGSYRIMRILGVGGFGVTYLCEHSGLGVQVAVKEYLPNEIAVRDGTEVHPKSAGDREGFEWGLGRFLDEARTLARFEHPNVVRVRDCFEANHTAYIVMDYEDGEPLDVLLKRHGTLTEAQLKRVLLPLADGLRQVHAAGFLHRDIKPANVFVRRSNESPVLLDFGSARQAIGRKSKSITAVVTRGYSPPEQYESDGEQGPWTDIYALSALCHRAITGQAPIEAPRRQSELLRKQADPLPRLAYADIDHYSYTFLEAVDWGLEVIETKRPQFVDEWLEAATTQEPEARTEAEQGDVHDYYNIGLMYAAGEIAPKNDLAAVHWFRKAAEQGLAEAQLVLGYSYEEGRGVAKDDSAAFKWYREAAEQGLPAAQHALAYSYEKGRGVAKDDSAAFKWYRKAAEQGLPVAQYSLAFFYYLGQGVPKNLVYSLAWLSVASTQYVPAQLLMEELETQMTPAQILEASQLSQQLVRNEPVAEVEKQWVGFVHEEAIANQQLTTEVDQQRVHVGTKPGTRFRDAPHCPEMVVVPAGSFMMGAPKSEVGSSEEERPVHRVTISQPFAVGVYPVTYEEWDAAIDLGFRGHKPSDCGGGRGRRPVCDMSWTDAQSYVEWLMEWTGQCYRLLSEAEWEYVARAGTTTPFHTGATITPLEANFDGRYDYPGDNFTEGGLYREWTVPVGSFEPNAFGLHDVHGNVLEWVQDSWDGWHESYAGAPTDGSAWEEGDCCDRVLRGGSWKDRSMDLRSAYRRWGVTDFRGNDVGFRVARTLTQ